MTWILVVAGGMLGAALRYVIDHVLHGAIRSRVTDGFPWGTLVVNVTGCLVLGLLIGTSSTSGQLPPFLGTGLCGALTTYSTFSHQTLRLVEDGHRGLAAVNAVASVVAGLGAAGIGIWSGRAF